VRLAQPQAVLAGGKRNRSPHHLVGCTRHRSSRYGRGQQPRSALHCFGALPTSSGSSAPGRRPSQHAEATGASAPGRGRHAVRRPSPASAAWAACTAASMSRPVLRGCDRASTCRSDGLTSGSVSRVAPVALSGRRRTRGSWRPERGRVCNRRKCDATVPGRPKTVARPPGPTPERLGAVTSRCRILAATNAAVPGSAPPATSPPRCSRVAVVFCRARTAARQPGSGDAPARPPRRRPSPRLEARLGPRSSGAVRYASWIGGLLRGQSAVSYAYETPTFELIAERLQVSLPLALLAMTLTVVVRSCSASTLRHATTARRLGP